MSVGTRDAADHRGDQVSIVVDGPRTSLSLVSAIAAATISEHQLASSHHRILVAFSGGADSTALLLTMKALGFEVIAAHIDHGMRPDSHQDLSVCHRCCEQLGVELIHRTLELGSVTEAVARDARYEALNEMQSRSGAHRIATGHTANDQAETVQMRIERGGVALGIPYMRGDVIRPLLDVSRELTEAVCSEAGLAYIQDPTNQDPAFTRNRIRKQLAGDRESIDGLIALGRRTRASVDEAQAMVELMFDRLVTAHDGLLRVDSAGLSCLDGRDLRAVIRKVIGCAGGNASAHAIEQIAAHVVPRTGARAAVGRGVEIWNEGTWLTAGPRAEPKLLPRIAVQVPGDVTSPEWRVVITVDRVALPMPADPGPSEAWLDADAFPGPLVIRSWLPGDRIVPFGMAGSTKLQDVFTDLKIPKLRRGTIPLLCSGDHILWVVGYKRADLATITPSTRSAIRVRVLPLKEPGD